MSDLLSENIKAHSKCELLMQHGILDVCGGSVISSPWRVLHVNTIAKENQLSVLVQPSRI